MVREENPSSYFRKTQTTFTALYKNYLSFGLINRQLQGANAELPLNTKLTTETQSQINFYGSGRSRMGSNGTPVVRRYIGIALSAATSLYVPLSRLITELLWWLLSDKTYFLKRGEEEFTELK